MPWRHELLRYTVVGEQDACAAIKCRMRGQKNEDQDSLERFVFAPSLLIYVRKSFARGYAFVVLPRAFISTLHPICIVTFSEIPTAHTTPENSIPLLPIRPIAFEAIPVAPRKANPDRNSLNIHYAHDAPAKLFSSSPV